MENAAGCRFRSWRSGGLRKGGAGMPAPPGQADPADLQNRKRHPRSAVVVASRVGTCYSGGKMRCSEFVAEAVAGFHDHHRPVDLARSPSGAPRCRPADRLGPGGPGRAHGRRGEAMGRGARSRGRLGGWRERVGPWPMYGSRRRRAAAIWSGTRWRISVSVATGLAGCLRSSWLCFWKRPGRAAMTWHRRRGGSSKAAGRGTAGGERGHRRAGWFGPAGVRPVLLATSCAGFLARWALLQPLLTPILAVDPAVLASYLELARSRARRR